MLASTALAALGAAFVFTGCGGGSETGKNANGGAATTDGSDGGSASAVTPTASPDANVKLAQSSVSRTNPEVPASDSTSLVRGDDDFTFAMYHQLESQAPTANLVFSPYSISLALSMTYAGAAGVTATQMASALDFDLAPSALFPAYDALDLSLAAIASAARAAGASGTNGQPFALTVASSLWADQSLPIAPAFLDTLARNYGAAVRLTDFEHQWEAARNEINGWVSAETNSKIPQLLPAGSISSNTELTLVNAVYFDASWLTPFNSSLTAPAAFTGPSGAVADVDTMNETTTLEYASEDGVQAVELPYAGNTTSMIVLLPDAAHAAGFDAALGTSSYTSLVSALTPTLVQLALPKFSIPGATIDLVRELQALGMSDAFDGKANFSALSSVPLAISHVYHQAFIQVDEAGTEAAAATAVVVDGDGGISAQPTPVPMVVNRPFAIFLRDIASGTVLFAGKVNTPGL